MLCVKGTDYHSKKTRLTRKIKKDELRDSATCRFVFLHSMNGESQRQQQHSYTNALGFHRTNFTLVPRFNPPLFIQINLLKLRSSPDARLTR
jgi:hypothetical protein